MPSRSGSHFGSETRACAGSPLPPSYSDFSDEEGSDEGDSSGRDHGSPLSRGLVYVSGTHPRNSVGFTHPAYSGKFLAKPASIPDDFAPHHVYFLDWNNDRAVFTALFDTASRLFRSRHDYDIPSSEYDEHVLRPLLIGARILDNDARKDSSLSAEERRQFYSDDSDEDEDGQLGRMVVVPTLDYLPLNINVVPAVTQVLEEAFIRKSIGDITVELLDRIYGPPRRYSFPSVRQERDSIWIHSRGTDVEFNDQQSEAMYRFEEDRPAQPDPSFSSAFVVEGGPGTGKTLLAAAIASTFPGQGLQLLLAPSEGSLDVLAEALHNIFWEKKVLYLGANHADFPHFTTGVAFEEYDDLEDLLQMASSDHEKRALRKLMRRARADAIAACDQQDVLIATVDTVLQMSLSEADYPVKQQLEGEVTRIVVDDSQELTEAALNALILAFPQAIFVFIGDGQQTLLETYAPGDLASDLASTPALSVLKRKKNLPIIYLRRTHRTLLCEHFSDVFYGGILESAVEEEGEEEDDIDDGVGVVEDLPPLAVLGPDVTDSLVFLELRNDATADEELDALVFVVRGLEREGVDDVMVLAFSGEQVERARSRLPDYDVNAVESAQGREASVVVLLTSTMEQHLCYATINISVSRHKSGLVVIGRPQLQAIEPWSRMLVPEYFDRVEYNRD